MNKILVSLIVLMFLSIFSYAEDDQELRERYGMNQKEWSVFKELGISYSKLEQLVKCGININEFQSRPWLSMGVSESDWLDERCEGLEDEEIDAFHDSKATGTGDVMLSLAFPGFYHWKTKDFIKGPIFTSIYLGSAALYVLHTSTDTSSYDINENKDKPDEFTTIFVFNKVRKPAYLAIMAADMVISMLISINDKNEAKKAADLEEEVYYRKQKLNFRYTMLNDNTSGFKLSYKF